MKLFQKCVVFLSVVTLLQLLVFAGLAALMIRAEREADQVIYSKEIITKATSITRGMQNWVASILIYLGTKNKFWLDHFNALSEELPKDLANLESNVQKDSQDYKDLKQAKECMEYLLGIAAESKARLKTNFSYLEVVKVKQQLRLGVQPRIAELATGLEGLISRHTSKVMKSPEIEQQRKDQLKILLLGGFVLNILATFIMVLGFNKGITTRISIIADNFGKFRKSRALNPPQSGSDEIGYLDKSFHELASELNEVSAKDKAIFANMPVGLIACDNSGSIESVNPTAENLLETDSNAMVGRNFGEFIMHRSPTASTVMEKIDLSTLKPDTYYLRRPHEKSFPAHVSLSNYQHAGQDKLLFSFVDVSAREEMENMKQEFISIISHDLRTPLSSIKGCLLMLAQGALGKLPEEATKYIGLASEESDRLIRLTSDLLDIARIESGHILFEKHSAACSELMERAFSSVKPLAEAKSISILIKPTELTVMADSDRTCQILINFLSNAIKYSDSNTKVILSAETNDSSVQFNVVDEGRGIPDEHLAGLFEKFKQVRSEDSKKGAGLGLAICKLLAEAQGGSVGVEAQASKGSKFWLRLPAV